MKLRFLSGGVLFAIVVIAAGPVANIIVAFVLIFAILVIVGPESITNRIGKVEPSTPAAGVLRPGDEIVSVDGVRGDPERPYGFPDRD